MLHIADSSIRITQTAAPAVRTAPTLGHDGKSMVICLPGGEFVPVEAPGLAKAKKALARVLASAPDSTWSEERIATWQWRRQVAEIAVDNERADVMAAYGIRRVNGGLIVDRDHWLGRTAA